MAIMPGVQDEFRPTISEIVVKKDDLLQILRWNRQGHRKVFEEAIQGYRKAVIDELEDRIDRATKGNTDAWKGIHIPEPEDHTRDYDRVIKSLEMSVHEEVYLDQNEIAQYVMDDWQWKHAFNVTASNYTKM